MSLLPLATKNPNKEIIDLISNNIAFVNPLAGKIATGVSAITLLKSTVNAIGFNPPLTPNPNYNPSVGIYATDIVNAVDTLLITFNRFKIHTDGLSGVSINGGLSGANFATLSTIATNVQKYHDESAVCSIVYGIFGALLVAENIANQINLLVGQIQNLLSFPDQVKTNLDFITSLLESQIANDLLAFANAELELLRQVAASALTSLLNDPCMGNIIASVATDEAKRVLNKNAREAINNL